jgi:hypothetical protein
LAKATDDMMLVRLATSSFNVSKYDTQGSDLEKDGFHEAVMGPVGFLMPGD